MSTRRSHRRIQRLLRDEPTLCLIKTPAGLYRTHRNWFGQLCNLPWLIRVAPRVARVADGFSVMIADGVFHAYRTDLPREIGPSFYTNSQVIERHFIYAVDGRSVSLLEREREAALQYGLFAVIEEAA